MNAVRRALSAALLLVLPLTHLGSARAASPEASATASTGKPAPSAPRAHTGTSPEAGSIAAPGTLPAGHPATTEPAADSSNPLPGSEPGSISATILDERGSPLVGSAVRLGILFQKIAEGESRSERFAQADAEGSAHFSGLTPGSDHAYRITVQRGPANYSSPPFNLRQDMGQHVVLHVYPSTTNVDQAMVGMRGYYYIETRDDVFQFEVLFRVFNVGQVTWVPHDVVMRLPHGFKAFKAQESMTDVGFEAVEGVGARLKGTFPPGQQEVSFRFQMPKSTEESAVFHVGLLPHVAEMRVIAEASSAMNLDVEGFDRPVPTANNNGQRVLVCVKILRRRDDEIKDFVATLSGIPVPGPGRWVALLVAIGFGIGGVFAARGAFDDVVGGKDIDGDKKSAREILLRELVSLEAARQAERIGPRSYEQSRSRLVDAVARLGLPEERPRQRRKQAAGSGARKRSKPAPERS